ncbi:MAG: signal peptidase I [Erysipelotrichaceae bacterium]|nr:signal peptidase I [Erysipelotrichaceae bacterium]
MNKRILKEIFDLAKTVIICFILVLLITTYIFKPIRVSGNSMYPTLKNNYLGISNILSLKLDGLKRFDIVTVYLENKGEYLVKRVIGLPNEIVRYTDNKLYINDVYVDEVFLNTPFAKHNNLYTEDFTYVLGQDEYFLMGDNRNNSSDSRYYGPFKLKDIKSKDIFTVFPLNSFGIKE